MQPNSLDPSAALGLYLKLGDGDWLYRGCIHNGHPTEVMPLQVGGEGSNLFNVELQSQVLLNPHSYPVASFRARAITPCAGCRPDWDLD